MGEPILRCLLGPAAAKDEPAALKVKSLCTIYVIAEDGSCCLLVCLPGVKSWTRSGAADEPVADGRDRRDRGPTALENYPRTAAD